MLARDRLENDMVLEKLNIPGFKLHLNSYGRGKGIATYYKEDLFYHVTDIKEENIQISKFTSSIIDVLVIYRSQKGDLMQLKRKC